MDYCSDCCMFIITIAGCSKAAKQPSPSNGQAQVQDDRTDEVFTLRVSYWAQDKNGYFEAVEKKFKAKYPNGSI